MTFAWIPEYLPYFVDGFINTIILVAVTAVLGFALAVVVALALVSGPAPVRWLAQTYTTVIRGTPLLVQLFFFYEGVGRLLPLIPGVRDMLIWPLLRDGFFYAVIAFTVSVGAYTGQVLRGALLSVPRGEVEAARAFGMSPLQIMWRIRLPRAIQICLPTLSGELILLLKSVPLVSTIAVFDLLKAANLVRDELFLVYEPLLLVAGIYLAVTLLLTTALRHVERTFPGVRPADEEGKALGLFAGMTRR